ncbi:hypothetical protein [Changchengzhania lutea]|uniref:hypothetical protein n=1 Tax=Changchengzhania lutea TaxID=2049305 RepID=UPI00115ED9DA|nr:hypothetical protein [Changchengzhania lutea]
MTAKQYAKRYDLALNFKIVAEKAYNAGLKQGKSEDKNEVFKRIEKEVKKLRLENKELNEVLNDGEKLADWIGGM